MNAKATPEGYLKNTQGHLVPRELVPDIDITRDDLVKEIVAAAHLLQDSMTGFKIRSMNDIAAFVEMSAEKYDTKVGGEKGNVTLTSYDGKYKVVRSTQEYITFDERLGIAKELVDECIHRWSQGTRAEIRALVEHAFQTDKQGKINRNSVLSLTKLKIEDPQWQQAMQAILDSQQVVGSKRYIRVFERVGDSDQYRPIVLDIAAL